MPVCDVCGRIVKDLRRHKERGRCGVKPERRSLPARYTPGTPENRLSLNNPQYVGNDEPADFANTKRRLKK